MVVLHHAQRIGTDRPTTVSSEDFPRRRPHTTLMQRCMASDSAQSMAVLVWLHYLPMRVLRHARYSHSAVCSLPTRVLRKVGQ
eukprot:2101595-Rhodomonas_salina.2